MKSFEIHLLMMWWWILDLKYLLFFGKLQNATRLCLANGKWKSTANYSNCKPILPIIRLCLGNGTWQSRPNYKNCQPIEPIVLGDRQPFSDVNSHNVVKVGLELFEHTNIMEKAITPAIWLILSFLKASESIRNIKNIFFFLVMEFHWSHWLRY